ncbi:MAG: hypothetical protein V3R20_04510 [Sphingomonadales bacterium]
MAKKKTTAKRVDFDPDDDQADEAPKPKPEAKPEPAPKPQPKPASGKAVRLDYDTPEASAQGCRVRKYEDGTKELIPK